jgi:hypothetical protein
MTMTMTTMRTRIAARRLSMLPLVLALACTAADGDDGDDDGSGDTAADSSDGGAAFDEQAALARAMDYQASFTQISAEGRASQHGLAKTVQMWASPEAVDLYGMIDPDGAAAAVSFPDGAMLLKEHLDDAGIVTGYTVMAKGDPASTSGGWWWGRLDADGTVHETGQVGFCIGCHTSVQATDWAYGVPLDNRR